jgi:hypothetical protein
LRRGNAPKQGTSEPVEVCGFQAGTRQSRARARAGWRCVGREAGPLV